MKNNGNKTESRNVYQMVTDRVIEQMRQGIIPWQRPWTGGGGCVNYVSRKPYSHLNQLLLGRPGEWLTFKQIQECGVHIKISYLQENYDEDAPIYLSHDNGYTYGGITEGRFTDEWVGEDEDNENQ